MNLYRIFCLLCTACISWPACGGIQVTKEQEEICTSKETDEENEKRFLQEVIPLPDDVHCLAGPTEIFPRRVSSPFRGKRHTFKPGRHTGTDYPMSPGTEILAVASGTVVYAKVNIHGVNSIKIDIGEGWKFQVLHLTEIRVNKGDKVSSGQLIGLSGGAVGAIGSGPCTTGPHLHISITCNSKFTNYEDLLCRRSSE